jgi:hypothetical protein
MGRGEMGLGSNKKKEDPRCEKVSSKQVHHGRNRVEREKKKSEPS